MAKFKCRQSGNIIEFVNDYDIATMKGHPEYDLLDEQQQVVVEPEEEHQLPFSPPTRGRPKKVK